MLSLYFFCSQVNQNNLSTEKRSQKHLQHFRKFIFLIFHFAKVYLGESESNMHKISFKDIKIYHTNVLSANILSKSMFSREKWSQNKIIFKKNIRFEIILFYLQLKIFHKGDQEKANLTKFLLKIEDHHGYKSCQVSSILNVS